MAEHKYEWQKELILPPVQQNPDMDWMEHVEGRTRNAPRRSRMRMSGAAILLVFVLVLGALLAGQQNLWGLLPDYREGRQVTELPLIEGDGIRIMADKFYQYKSGIELGNKWTDLTPMHLSDAQIIDNIISQALAVQYARKEGLKVTAEEIDKEVAYQRDELKQAPADNPIHGLMEERIKMSGMSDDEFWNSELIRGLYGEAVLLGKLQTKLAEEGTITAGAGESLEQFKNELLEASRAKIKVNWQVLETAGEGEE